MESKKVKEATASLELSEDSAELSNEVPVITNTIYSCPDCGAVFHNPIHLKKHKLKHQTGEILMGKVSETASADLITEVELLLEDDSIFKKRTLISCELCPSAFSSQSKLNDHMLKHTGERPFKCPLCSKSYPVKGIRITRYCL